MNAEQAREITRQNPNVDHKFFINLIYGKIEKSAKKGKSSINQIFRLLPSRPSFEVQKSIVNELRAQGYIYTEHRDPDFPRTILSTTLSW